MTAKLPALENNSSLILTKTKKSIISQAENAGEQCFIINFKFADDCSFKTIRASMVLDKIAEVAKIIKSVPATEEFDEQKLSQGFKMAGH